MKRWGGFILLFFALLGTAGSLAEFDSVACCYRVNTGVFQCTFFDGHLYPIWFKSMGGAQKNSLGRDDFIVWGGKKYFLSLERFCSFFVLKDTPEEFVLESRGVPCCREGRMVRPLSGTKVRCRYLFKRGNPEIDMEFRVSGMPSGAAVTFSETSRGAGGVRFAVITPFPKGQKP